MAHNVKEILEELAEAIYDKYIAFKEGNKDISSEDLSKKYLEIVNNHYEANNIIRLGYTKKSFLGAITRTNLKKHKPEKKTKRKTKKIIPEKFIKEATKRHQELVDQNKLLNKNEHFDSLSEN